MHFTAELTRFDGCTQALATHVAPVHFLACFIKLLCTEGGKDKEIGLQNLSIPERYNLRP